LSLPVNQYSGFRNIELAYLYEFGSPPPKVVPQTGLQLLSRLLEELEIEPPYNEPALLSSSNSLSSPISLPVSNTPEPYKAIRQAGILTDVKCSLLPEGFYMQRAI